MLIEALEVEIILKDKDVHVSCFGRRLMKEAKLKWNKLKMKCVRRHISVLTKFSFPIKFSSVEVRRRGVIKKFTCLVERRTYDQRQNLSCNEASQDNREVIR